MPFVLVVLAIGLVIIGLVAGGLGWMHARRPAARAYDMAGKRVLITGGNSGIGLQTAVKLARSGAEVIITARNAAKGADAVAAIREASGSDRVEAMDLDLASLASVRAFAADFRSRFDRLDVLVNNAGLIQGERCTTVDGFETTMGVNHLGPFLLTNELLPLLEASAPSRIVNLASIAHRQAELDLDDLMSEQGTYAGLTVYGRSKLANVLFTRELARRLEGSGVTVNAVHPGTVRTGFAGDGDTGWLFTLGITMARPFFLSPEQGARTSVYVAASPELDGVTGGYYDALRLVDPSDAGRDEDLARGLWERSAALVGIS